MEGIFFTETRNREDREERKTGSLKVFLKENRKEEEKGLEREESTERTGRAQHGPESHGLRLH